MFDPLDFLKLAEELSASPGDEAKLRTSIGRAYYSAFLKAREWLKPKSLKSYNGPEAHKEVQDDLERYKERMLKDKLSKLRRRRNEADYNLSRVIKEMEANDAVVLSKEIVKGCL